MRTPSWSTVGKIVTILLVALVVGYFATSFYSKMKSALPAAATVESGVNAETIAALEAAKKAAEEAKVAAEKAVAEARLASTTAEAKAKAEAEARVKEEAEHKQKLSDLRSENSELMKAKLAAETKAKAEAAAREVVKKELDQTWAGEARVVFEQYDPKRHRANRDRWTEVVEHQVQGEHPKFDVSSATVRVRTKEGLVNAYPVMTPQGEPLKVSDFTPKLKNSNLKPYRLAVWWESQNAFVEHWFAK